MYEEREVFGPFHRREAPTGQDAEALIRQVLSGELWGLAPRTGGDPRVKAFRGPLPSGQSGVEFWAFAAPDDYGPRVFWRSPGRHVAVDTELHVVKLQLAFVKITQDLHPMSDPISWNPYVARFDANPAAAIALDRAAWERNGAVFVERDDGDDETPGLAVGEIVTDAGVAPFGVLDYGEAETFLLVPGRGRMAVERANAILAALEAAGVVDLATQLANFSAGDRQGSSRGAPIEIDELTGLLYRRAFLWAAERAHELAPTGVDAVLVLVDLDDFKAFNDREGHAAGDRLLVELATAWKTALRPGDMLARLGGDDFALLLPATAEDGASRVLARLREAHPAAWSSGVAIWEHGAPLRDALTLADLRLEEAKRGRAESPIEPA